jgi:hypothetical protein
MFRLMIFIDRYFSCAKLLILLDYHRFMVMIGDD